MTITMNKDPAISVWIQGNCGAGMIRAMLASCKTLKFKPANTILAADMILYTGGADVSPSLYNESILGCSFVDFARDRDDMDCFTVARRSNKFQVGICRGSQFLNVMNGGQLWQDVDGHAGKNHLVQDVSSEDFIEVSSTHHQQIILNTDQAIGPHLLAWAAESTRKLSAKGGGGRILVVPPLTLRLTGTRAVVVLVFSGTLSLVLGNVLTCSLSTFTNTSTMFQK